MKIIYIIFLLSLFMVSNLKAQQQEQVHCAFDLLTEEQLENEPSILLSQNSKSKMSCNSSTDVCKGIYAPAQGDVRTLLVYIRFADDTDQSINYWTAYPNSSDIYDVESFMENSINSSVANISDNYFNISNYFNTMSDGDFNIIGEAVYLEAPSLSSYSSSLTAQELQREVNIDILEALDANPNIDLTEYDNWKTLGANWHQEVSDGILDNIYMIYRNPQSNYIFNHGGIANLNAVNGLTDDMITLNSGLKVQMGLSTSNGGASGISMSLGSGKKDRKSKFDDSYIHEYAHHIFGAGHPYGHGYWGIFGGNSGTNSINAYEKELLGWLDSTQVTEIQMGQTYTLNDFLENHEVLRYTVDEINDEYYYFENHQRTQSTTGISSTYDIPNYNISDKGIFILHAKGAVNSSNSLRSIVSDGNWDWVVDSWSSACGSDYGENPAWVKTSPNQKGDSFKGRFSSVTNPQSYFLSKPNLYIKGEDTSECIKYFLGLDSQDYSSFNIDRSPIISSITNPRFLTHSDNDVNLTMKILFENNGQIQVVFYDNYNPYTITENTTWDGQIFLDEFTEVDNNATLTILPGTTVYLSNNVTLAIRPGAKLISEGTEEEPIRFERAHQDSAWNRISLNSSAGNRIKWSLFDGGYINLSIASKNNVIEHSTFRNATYRTMMGWHNQDGSGNASASISYSLIENSPTVGLVSHYLDLDLSYTTIQNNTQAGLYILSNTVYPFHHNLITGNGGTNRDGIEVKSSGTLYMQDAGQLKGFNKVSGNGEDQISNSGDLIIGSWHHLNPYGGHNHIYGNYSGSRYLVENNSGYSVEAYYNWWGPNIYSGMFSGSLDGTSYNLSSDPTNGVNHGHGGQAPSKALPNSASTETESLADAYDAAENQLREASSSLQVRNSLHKLYQIAGLSRKENPELTSRFRQLTESAVRGSENMYSSSEQNNVLSNTAKVLHAKSFTREGEYEEAQAWLKETNASSLEGYDRRDWLHLNMVTETYHGDYETAWQTLQEYYAFQESQGEDMEEVKAGHSPFEEDLKVLIEAGEGESGERKKQSEEMAQSEGLTLGNYPNPFNPTTNIRFALPEQGQVSLVVYDMIGREVATLVNDILPAGDRTIRFDASSLANGIYLYKLRAGTQEITRTMTLIK
ncbi:MAG: T9SS type A sorting domain-containing protein [Balneolaceae bacterium]